ncbi:MAG TPA: tripartite tricarboxylate transporter substrate-binding protein [Xanthobacteraceae bacterium]|nr:tripartite tricarboxylate transporter substrate-binding protein [Xanthobacteraceae bacterium]
MLLISGAALLAPRFARAAFPERTLRILVGFAAGGTVDTIARILANALSPILGQQVIVENKPGGSGSIAANAAIYAEPDGHTLLFGIFSLAVAPALVKLGYDTAKDLTAVSQVASVPLLMFAGGNTPYRNVADVVAAAQAAPGMITYATGGVGSSSHMAAELFARRAGITLVHVPFRGSAAAIQSLVAGDVQLLWDTPNPTTHDFIEKQQLKSLAVMTRARLPAYPGIPAIGEVGLGDDLEVQAWQGVLVRAGTAPDIVATLHRAIVQAMSLPDTKARIEAMSVEPMATDPAAFDAFFKSEVARWTEVARRAGITAQ